MRDEVDSAAEEAQPVGTTMGQVPRRPGRVGGRIAAVLAALVTALVFGVTTAEADGTLGPHLAHYQTTVDHEITVDFGPLGTLVIDSPTPAVLGARVVVREIPAELTSLDEAGTIEGVSADLQRYVQFFGAPQATIEAALRALVADALRRTAIAFLVLVGIGVLVRRVLGRERRGELAVALRRRRVVLASGTALTVVLAGTLTTSGVRAPTPAPLSQASTVFDGTPLEGARITGRLAGLIDTYGGEALAAYRANEAYYAAAADSVEQAWGEQQQREQAAAALDHRNPPSGKVITALVVSDLHCNVGMAGVIQRVAALADVDLVLNAGDSTVDGTPVESYCVQTFARAVPGGVPYVIADGNHDSEETSAEERAVGATVLSGHVVEVAGLHVLGDSDPNETRIGEGTRPKGDETAAEEAQRLADVACKAGDVDLLLIHTPSVGDAALQSGCVPVQVSGHLHARFGPLRVAGGVRYISSSTAGALLGEPTVGPLRGTAELTLLHFDAQTHAVLDYRLIQVKPSGVAVVGPRVGWPTAPEPEPAPGSPI